MAKARVSISSRVARNLRRAVSTLTSDESKARTTDGTAEVTATEGGVWISIPGSEAPTPVNGSVACEVAKGDTVSYRIENGRLSITGNSSTPSIGSEKAASFVEPVADEVRDLVEQVDASNARTADVVRQSKVIGGIANAAKSVADATNQHFFADDNGVHVTEKEQADWEQAHEGANILLNSIGQLFRDGLTNLISITTQSGARAITFWDGLGNGNGNVTASFGADESRIGYIPTFDTSATYFTSSGLRIKSRSASGGFPLYDVAGIVATDGYILDTTTLRSRDDWTYTLLFTPAAYTDIEVYGRGSTGGSRVLIGTFTYGIPETITHGNATYTYDGDVTIQHVHDPEVASSAIALFGYRRYTDANHPWLHVGYIDQEQPRAGNTISAGTYLLAKSENQAVFGKYNANDPDNAFEIGNGTADNARSNALTVTWTGIVNAAGATLSGALSATSATISGALSATSATLSGALSAASATIDGLLSAAKATITKDSTDTGTTALAINDGTDGVLTVDWSGNVEAAGTVTATLQESIVTASTDITTGSNNHCWHNGVVCTISLAFNLVSSLANGGTVTVGTVPIGYRPPYTVYGSVYNNTAGGGGVRGYLTNAGSIVVRNLSGAALDSTANLYIGFTFAL